MIKEITIELKNKKIQISVEEARVLLSELKELFGENTNQLFQYPAGVRDLPFTPLTGAPHTGDINLGPNSKRSSAINKTTDEQDFTISSKVQNINPNKIIKEVKLEEGIGE